MYVLHDKVTQGSWTEEWSTLKIEWPWKVEWKLVRLYCMLYWNCQWERIISEKLTQYFLFHLSDCQFLLQMLLWITENRQEFLLNYTEIGHDTASAEELQDEHQNFETSCMVRDIWFKATVQFCWLYLKVVDTDVQKYSANDFHLKLL